MADYLSVLSYVFKFLRIKFINESILVLSKNVNKMVLDHFKVRVFTEGDVKDLTHFSDGASENYLRNIVRMKVDLNVNIFLPHACGEGYYDLFVDLVKQHPNRKNIESNTIMKAVKMLWVHFQPSMLQTPNKMKEKYMKIQQELYNRKEVELNDIFLEAIKLGLSDNVYSLMDHPKVDVTYQNNLPLRMACSFPNLDIVKILTRHPSVNPSASNSEALLWATEQGNFDIVEFLLEDGRVDPFSRDSYCLRIASEAFNRTKEIKYRKVLRVLKDNMGKREKELEDLERMLKQRQYQFERSRKEAIEVNKKLSNTFIDKKVLKNLFTWMNHPDDVFSILCVCKSWRSYAEKLCCSPTTNNNDNDSVIVLDDFGSWHPFHKVLFVLKRKVNRLEARLWMVHSLFIKSRIELKDFELLNCFPRLGYLDINQQNEFNDNIASKYLSRVHTLQVNTCDSFEGLELGKLKSLRSLRIYRCELFRSKKFCDIPLLRELLLYKVKRVNEEDLKGLKNLKDLTCVDIKMFPGIVIKDIGEQFEVFKFGDSSRAPDIILGKMRNLMSLTIENCKLITGSKLPFNETLRNLKLSWCPNMKNIIMKSCPNIVSLEISLCDRINSKGIKHLKRLKYLRLDFCIVLTDKIFSCGNIGDTLERLEIRECGNMDGSGFKYLKKLKFLMLFRTTKITDHELVPLKRLEVMILEETSSLTGDLFHIIGVDEKQIQQQQSSPSKKKKKKKKKKSVTEEEEEEEEGESRLKEMKFINCEGLNKERIVKNFKSRKVKIIFSKKPYAGKF